jgi:hypothetical protein
VVVGTEIGDMVEAESEIDGEFGQARLSGGDREVSGAVRLYGRWREGVSEGVMKRG